MNEDKVVALDERCVCGWLFPLSIIAFPEDADPEDNDNMIPNSKVALTCPQCHAGHQFFVAPVDAATVTVVRAGGDKD